MLHPAIHFLPLIRDRVAEGTGSGERPRPASPQWQSLAPPGGSRGITRPEGTYNPYSKFWVCPWPPSRTCLKNLQREAIRRHLHQMPEPPQLTFWWAGAAALLWAPPDGQAPHPMSKAKPSHSLKETYFICMYPMPLSFGHYPALVTIGEGGTKMD